MVERGPIIIRRLSAYELFNRWFVSWCFFIVQLFPEPIYDNTFLKSSKDWGLSNTCNWRFCPAKTLKYHSTGINWQLLLAKNKDIKQFCQLVTFSCIFIGLPFVNKADKNTIPFPQQKHLQLSPTSLTMWIARTSFRFRVRERPKNIFVISVM